MSIAVCDPEAFYPFRRLVEGPLTDLSEIAAIELFVRTVLLHDEIVMELDPWPDDPDIASELTEEERLSGGRNVVVGIGPVLRGYGFFADRSGPGQPETPAIQLSPALIDVAREFSKADEGNVYYEAHIEHLQRIVGIVQRGGSALLASHFGTRTIGASTLFPARLFEDLDREWQKFAQDADAGEFGFVVPPVLSIVLTQCSRRDAIPNVLQDLRNQWRDAREKVWMQVDRLKNSRTVGEADEIRRELAEASRLISPARSDVDTTPVRMLWDLIAGAVTGGLAAPLAGVRPGVGAGVGALNAAARSVPPLIHGLGSALFGRGSFDLARQVHRELARVEYDALGKLLSDPEKRKLRL